MHKLIPGAISHERHEMPLPDRGIRIKWFGIVRHDPGKLLPLQVHGNYELSLMTEGTAVITVNKQPHRLGPGDLFVTKPGDQHMMIGGDDYDWSKIYVGVDRIEPQELDLIFRNTETRLVPNCLDLLPEFERIVDEVRRPRLGTPHVVQLLMNAWLFEVGRRLSDCANENAVHDYSQAVLDACSYMELNARHGLELNDVAKAINLSKFRLAHIFSDEMNMPVGDFLRQLVMHRALRLLEDNTMNVSEVAGTLGFPSLYAFSAAFKRHWGVPPTQYQRSILSDRSRRPTQIFKHELPVRP